MLTMTRAASKTVERRRYDRVAGRKRIRDSSLAAETRFEARANRRPIGFGQLPNQADFTL
jgi:hypothetical protein